MRMGRTVVATFAVLFAAPVFAGGSWANTPIEWAIVQDGGSANHPGVVVVQMPTNQSGTTSCQSAQLNRFIIDLSRPASKAQFAMLLAANATGRNVTITLNDSCLESLGLLRNIQFAD